MGFGGSYSLAQVDCLDFKETSIRKRVVRSILAGFLCAGIFLFF